MQNPFTTTFSKSPGSTYIDIEGTDIILENFSYDNPSESVYKITGVRGSGKTVILAKIEEALRTDPNMNSTWLILDLNPARDMLVQMAAMLAKCGYGQHALKSQGFNVSASVLGTGGGIGFSKENSSAVFDIGVELEDMIIKAAEDNKKMLVAIDEVSKTAEMTQFASEYGRWLRAGYPVYLVCTGLYENMQEVSNVKNLTFFRRASTIKTEPLNTVRMSEMYRSKLQMETSEAKSMAEITKGYAYAFQKLGSILFTKKSGYVLDDVLQQLKVELFSYSYEKIWEEMSEGDRTFAMLLSGKDEYKRAEVIAQMGPKANNYSVYRERLLRRGLLNSRQAFIGFALPFFGEYISEYGTMQKLY